MFCGFIRTDMFKEKGFFGRTSVARFQNKHERYCMKQEPR